MPDKDSEITSELADLTERKRHEAELEHLASFPRLNPNPVLELGATGKVIFCNRAAEEVLKSVDCSKSANPFIPKHLQEILQALKQKRALQFTREIKIGDVFFEENISLVPQLNVVRIYAMDITTRKRAEEKLRASRRQFYSLYFNMAEGVALHDLVYDDRGTTVNYRLVDINPSYEKILHLRRDEVIGRLATEAYGVSAPPYLEEFREVAVKRTPRRLETYFPPMARYFDISIVPWGSSGFATIFTDITDRKQMEAELRESEKLLNKGQEIAHLGSWELDVVCNILTWSDEVYRIFGFQSQAFVATYEAFLEAVHPDDRQAVDSAYSGSLCEGRDTYEIEHRIVRRPTGEIRYVHEKCEHIRDEAGRVIRSVGMVHDITEHKKVEEAQKESYRRYRSLFENMLDGFAYCKMLFDDQGRPDDFVYLDVNSAFSRLTGLDNVVGKKVTKAIPGIKESHPELFEIYGRVALTGRPETFEIEFKPLGLWLFVAVYSIQREYFVAVFDNITERKQAEVVLIKANEELEIRVAERTEELEKSRMELEMKNEELHETNHELEMETAERIKALEELREKEQMLIQQGRMAAMGEMLGNIAHQWRQPLNVLGLKVQEIGVSYELGGFSKELLDANIAKAMEILIHLSQTIDDFWDFSAPDKEKSLFSVEQTVAKTVSLIEESFREKHINIEVCNAGELQINGYPNEYGQVLLNIMMNARDAFIEQGTNDARITVRSWAEDGRSVLTITDNAGGIKEGIMDKIFDAYFTTKELGKGTGIGLFMSKTIIEKDMGGRLTVHNVEGGAEFRIEV